MGHQGWQGSCQDQANMAKWRRPKEIGPRSDIECQAWNTNMASKSQTQSKLQNHGVTDHFIACHWCLSRWLPSAVHSAECCTHDESNEDIVNEEKDNEEGRTNDESNECCTHESYENHEDNEEVSVKTTLEVTVRCQSFTHAIWVSSKQIVWILQARREPQWHLLWRWM